MLSAFWTEQRNLKSIFCAAQGKLKSCHVLESLEVKMANGFHNLMYATSRV